MEPYKLEPRKDNSSKYNFRREDAYMRAQKRVNELKGFYWHLFSYIAVNIFIIVVIAINSNGNIWNFGTFATAFFWGIGLGFHAFGVFGKNVFFGRDWERRKMEEFMRNEENQNRK
ncbi:2TM domain-containing protein [Yeosuana sp. MJ-SS3]|uniref:2TM domain-containing protein n=1 Tax=Gilvirhabdus luticola TaxID=3079858 RepID=A0ABU3U7W7_9FLAO|nr:2TM domain-containing protein [Yeosuana sp. MJ-SS3]MDU8886502.1 2TM domain-containing protein [Yeosuana sp. MJ-SS3]